MLVCCNASGWGLEDNMQIVKPCKVIREPCSSDANNSTSAAKQDKRI